MCIYICIYVYECMYVCVKRCVCRCVDVCMCVSFVMWTGMHPYTNTVSLLSCGCTPIHIHTNTDPCVHTGGYDSFGSCMHWGPYFALDYYEMTCQSYTLPKVSLIFLAH